MNEIPRKASKVDRLAQALADGKHWRAKEILSGRIGSCDFDPALYEQYGVLLLHMGDLIEAGRFLFLSGRRQQAYERPIALFLKRTSRAGYRSLLAGFPNAARRLTWDELPAQLQEDLQAAGVPKIDPGSRLWARLPPPELGATGCLRVVLALVALGLIVSWLILQGYLL